MFSLYCLPTYTNMPHILLMILDMHPVLTDNDMLLMVTSSESPKASKHPWFIDMLTLPMPKTQSGGRPVLPPSGRLPPPSPSPLWTRSTSVKPKLTIVLLMVTLLLLVPNPFHTQVLQLSWMCHHFCVQQSLWGIHALYKPFWYNLVNNFF